MRAVNSAATGAGREKIPCAPLRRVGGTAAALFLCGFLLLGAGPPKTFTARAERVVDGDSIIFPQGVCRLIGIDAPEIAHGAKTGQPWGREAQLALAGQVGMGQVTVLVYGFDKYGRMLCAILDAHGYLINLTLLESGLAQTYMLEKSPFANGFLAAESRAKKAQIGIWGLSNYESPADYRRRLKVQ